MDKVVKGIYIEEVLKSFEMGVVVSKRNRENVLIVS